MVVNSYSDDDSSSCNSLVLVTLNNASDYRANGLLSDYIGWTNGLSDFWANGLGLGVR